jgi:hypothetical protein
MTTIDIKNQTTGSIKWLLLNTVFSTIVIFISGLYIIPGLLSLVLALDFWTTPNWATWPPAVFISLCLAGILFKRSYQDPPPLYRRFLVNELFDRETYYCILQGKTLVNPLWQKHDDILWTTRTWRETRELSSQKDTHPTSVVCSWNPSNANFLKIGKDRSERETNAKNLTSSIWSEVKKILTDDSFDPDKFEYGVITGDLSEKGIDLELRIEAIEPSDEVKAAMNEEIEAEKLSNAIDKLQRGDIGEKDALRMFLAYKDKSKIEVKILSFEGNVPENLKHEVETQQ